MGTTSVQSHSQDPLPQPPWPRSGTITETSLTMTSLGPGAIQLKTRLFVWEAQLTDTNNITIFLVEVPVMNVLLSLPTQACLRGNSVKLGHSRAAHDRRHLQTTIWLSWPIQDRGISPMDERATGGIKQLMKLTSCGIWHTSGGVGPRRTMRLL